MRPLLPLAALCLAGCAPDTDVSGEWLASLYADGSTWASGLLALEDARGTITGQAQLGAGGEIVLDAPITGEQADGQLSLEVEGPDARSEEDTIAFAFVFTATSVSEDTLEGSFVATAPASGDLDLLEGREGTWLAGKMPAE